MSLGYASRLSDREDLGGRLGDPELFESPYTVLVKAHVLADLIQAASSVIAFTGAGISTACGIPDFRGPQGVWTAQRKGLPMPKLQTSFVYAKPSLTHQALLGLLQSGKLRYICSQNVDSLHLRSGVSRDKIAELHGNCFAERCKKCKKEYVRDFEMDTVGFKLTGRHCTKPGCSGPLADHILDWEDALPNAEFEATKKHASSADLALCLGTSLQIIPAANLPLRTVKAGGKLAIINLQATPKDNKAAVVIHAKVDEIMAVVMQRLGVPIPLFMRTDQVLLSHIIMQGSPEQDNLKQEGTEQQEGRNRHRATPMDQSADAAATADTEQSLAAAAPAVAGTNSSNNDSNWGFTLCISSIHGSSCPMPMILSAHVSFQASATADVLPAAELSGEQLPWKLHRQCPGSLKEVTVLVQLTLVDAADADKRSHEFKYAIVRTQCRHPTTPGPSNNSSSSQRPRSSKQATNQQRQQEEQLDGSKVFSFITQMHDYATKQQELIAQLESAAKESRQEAAAQPAAPSAAPSKAKGRGRLGNSRQGSKWQQGIQTQAQHNQQNGVDGGDTGVVLSGQNGTSSSPGASPEVAQDSHADTDPGGASGGEAATPDTRVYVIDESTGQEGQNTSGRARKRTRRLDV